MADERFVRWQKLGIAQLSVAVALISGLSVSGMGVGLVLLRDSGFLQATPYKAAFGMSLLLLMISAISSGGAVVTRLLDFRLTARQVRKKKNPGYDKPLVLFWRDSEAYGCATWRLFWIACISFLVGFVLLASSIGAAYVNLLR